MSIRNLLITILLVLSSNAAFGTDKAAPQDWVKTDCGHFTLFLPPDMKEEKVRGIDSDVRQFKSASIALGSDYGRYSDTLDRGYPKPFETIMIGGKQARIIVYDGAGEFPFLCNIHFPDTGKAGVTLTLGGGCKTKAALEILQRIYGTIRFK